MFKVVYQKIDLHYANKIARKTWSEASLGNIFNIIKINTKKSFIKSIQE